MQPIRLPVLAARLVIVLVSVLAAPVSAVNAGSFNCAVVYDEFESLMNKSFLVEPDRYVRTLPGRISKEQFDGVSNADFHLHPSRKGMGIGILLTNLNIHAKFLFHWSQPMVDGMVHVIIDEVVKYGRVADGYAPTRIGPFRLKPGMSIDLDSGNYAPMDSEMLQAEAQGHKRDSADLQYEVGDDGVVLKAVNGAQVQFPLETLCQQGTA